MRKIVFIIALSLFCLYCNAQTTHGFSIGYAPWGFERMRGAAFWLNNNKLPLEGFHTFGKPVLKLDFEIRRGGSFIQQIGLTYSSVNADVFDSLHTYLDTWNIQSVGLFYRPGFTIMPYRRVQIPIFLSLGMNTFFGDGDWYGLMFDFGLMAQLKIYVTNQLAIYGGYTIQWGASKTSKSFRHYPDFGVLYNF